MVRNKVICEKCGREISRSNIGRHLKSHEKHPDLLVKKETYHLDHFDLFCKFCGKECKNKNSLVQHEIRCEENPNRINVYVSNFNDIGLTPWNKGLTKETDERVMQSSITYHNNIKTGKTIIKGHPHTEEFKLKMRNLAIERGLGGFNMRRGKYYNNIKLDSSYEVLLAKDLDDNNIQWERCDKFLYHIDGKAHWYTPDFYLPEYNIYLDPKNDFLIENINPKLGFKDIDKINQVMLENNINILILNKDQLTWEAIKTML